MVAIKNLNGLKLDQTRFLLRAGALRGRAAFLHPSLRLFGLVLFVSGALAGCIHPGQPVVAERSPVFDEAPLRSDVRTYTVRRSDTLYSIAWRFELEYQGFAQANGIKPPYTIFPGQKLRLTHQYRSGLSKRPSSSSRQAGQPKTSAKPPPVRSTKKTTPNAPSKTVAMTPIAPTTKWVWPVSGKPIREFSAKRKGIDFAVLSDRGANQRKVERSIRSAGNGQVVYAGNGIGGYERLIIIKHANELLSAYSFNGQTRAAEQQTVKAGTVVADIKSTGRSSQIVHFEIRRNGKPIDPRSLVR